MADEKKKQENWLKAFIHNLVRGISPQSAEQLRELEEQEKPKPQPEPEPEKEDNFIFGPGEGREYKKRKKTGGS